MGGRTTGDGIGAAPSLVSTGGRGSAGMHAVQPNSVEGATRGWPGLERPRVQMKDWVCLLRMWCVSGIHRIPDKQTRRKVSRTAVPRKTETLLEGDVPACGGGTSACAATNTAVARWPFDNKFRVKKRGGEFRGWGKGGIEPPAQGTKGASRALPSHLRPVPIQVAQCTGYESGYGRKALVHEPPVFVESLSVYRARSLQRV